MTNVSRVDVTVGAGDLARLDAGVSANSGGADVDLAVGTLLGGVTLHIGLDRLLNSQSPVDHLLNGPDALARFRAGDVPADPSPIATRGMTVRAGDPYSEVATRYSVGAAAAVPAARIDAAARLDDGGVSVRAAMGGDPGGVTAVRDPVAAAGLPQRIDAPGGTSAAGRGIDVGAMVTATNFFAAGAPAATVSVSLGSLVNVLGAPGAAVASPADAPVGAVLVYRSDSGATVVELRTAGGFTGATTTSALPLTGTPSARVGDGYTLVGVLVGRDGALPISPFLAGAAVTGLAATNATATVAPATVGPMTAPPAPGSPIAPANVAPDAATARTTTGAPPPPPGTTGAPAGAVPPPPDGSEIPAGHPSPPGDQRQGFDSAASDRGGPDGPYIHAIWYDILALRFAELGVSLHDRAPALRDAVWATAMEHGPFANGNATDVLSALCRQIDLTAASDADIVSALFAERGRMDRDGNLVHYPEVLPFDRERVTARLADEAEIAASRLVAG